MDKYMVGCSGWLSDMQPASISNAKMAQIARISDGFPRVRPNVVAYQQWMNGERGGVLASFRGDAAEGVIPGRCFSIEPGTSRFRARLCEPPRNDLPQSYAAKIRYRLGCRPTVSPGRRSRSRGASISITVLPSLPHSATSAR